LGPATEGRAQERQSVTARVEPSSPSRRCHPGEGHVRRVDWASERHAVCVLDNTGRTATAFVITHTADGV
jgi:hypothetical protein